MDHVAADKKELFSVIFSRLMHTKNAPGIGKSEGKKETGTDLPCYIPDPVIITTT